MIRPGRSVPILVLALAGGGLLTRAPAAAHEGHRHTAMGTVKAVEATRLELELKDAKVETFALTDATTYRRGDEATSREALEVGERAVVTYETKDGRNLAIEVKVAAKKAEGRATARPGGSAPDGRR